jgi:hypothetical protein
MASAVVPPMVRGEEALGCSAVAHHELGSFGDTDRCTVPNQCRSFALGCEQQAQRFVVAGKTSQGASICAGHLDPGRGEPGVDADDRPLDDRRAGGGRAAVVRVIGFVILAYVVVHAQVAAQTLGFVWLVVGLVVLGVLLVRGRRPDLAVADNP